MKRRVNKTQLVKDYLKKHGKITQLDAYLYCRYATRLSGIIYNLRAEGWLIDTVPTKGESGANYATYVLIAIGGDIED